MCGQKVLEHSDESSLKSVSGDDQAPHTVRREPLDSRGFVVVVVV